MKNLVWFLPVMLLLLTACSGSGEALLVYVAVDEDGGALPELVVADSSGTELRRINLPEQPTNIIPLDSGYKTLVWSRLQEQHWFLVDAMANTVQELSLDVNVEFYPRTIGQHVAVFSGPQDEIYLANLETGETTNLHTAEYGYISGNSVFSPDEKYLAIQSFEDAWLVPIADLAQVRRLESYWAGRVTFSGDGKKIIYNIYEHDAGIMVEDIDGSNQESYLFGYPPAWVWGFVPGSNHAFIACLDDETILYDLETDQKRQIIRECGGYMVVFPEWQKMLMVTEERHYYIYDIVAGEAYSLENISGYTTHNGCFDHPGARWVYFTDIPLGTRSLISLDLETDQAQEVIHRPEGLDFSPLYSGDCGMAWIHMFDGDTSQVWLLDAETNELHLITEGERYLTSSISPDNRWLAVSISIGEITERQYQVFLYDVVDGEPIKVGDGFLPVWLNP